MDENPTSPDAETASEEPEGEKEIDIEEVIDETEVPAPPEGEPAEGGEGFATGVNNAFGRIFTLDLDPEEEDTSQLRQQLTGLAEDVRLGHNASRFFQEYVFTSEEPDPKMALMGSSIAAVGLAVAVRPELAEKLKKKTKRGVPIGQKEGDAK